METVKSHAAQKLLPTTQTERIQAFHQACASYNEGTPDCTSTGQIRVQFESESAPHPPSRATRLPWRAVITHSCTHAVNVMPSTNELNNSHLPKTTERDCTKKAIVGNTCKQTKHDSNLAWLTAVQSLSVPQTRSIMVF
jgi:hypothetical protein